MPRVFSIEIIDIYLLLIALDVVGLSLKWGTGESGEQGNCMGLGTVFIISLFSNYQIGEQGNPGKGDLVNLRMWPTFTLLLIFAFVHFLDVYRSVSF